MDYFISHLSIPAGFAEDKEFLDLIKTYFSDHYGAIDWHIVNTGDPHSVELDDVFADDSGCNWFAYPLEVIEAFLLKYEKVCPSDWVCEVKEGGGEKTYQKDTLDRVPAFIADIIS